MGYSNIYNVPQRQLRIARDRFNDLKVLLRNDVTWDDFQEAWFKKDNTTKAHTAAHGISNLPNVTPLETVDQKTERERRERVRKAGDSFFKTLDDD